MKMAQENVEMKEIIDKMNEVEETKEKVDFLKVQQQ